jgi:hypothetical protein
VIWLFTEPTFYGVEAPEILASARMGEFPNLVLKGVTE